MQALLRRLAEVYYSAVDTRASLCQACASLCNFTFSFQLLFCGCELLEHIEKLLSFLLQLLLFLSTALYRTTHLDELFRTLVLQCCTTLHCGTGATLCLEKPQSSEVDLDSYGWIMLNLCVGFPLPVFKSSSDSWMVASCLILFPSTYFHMFHDLFHGDPLKAKPVKMT